MEWDNPGHLCQYKALRESFCGTHAKTDESCPRELWAQAKQISKLEKAKQVLWKYI